MRAAAKRQDQADVVEQSVMDELLDENGQDNPATWRDIHFATELSVATVHRALKNLEARGLIEEYMTMPNGARGQEEIVYKLRRTAKAA